MKAGKKFVPSQNICVKKMQYAIIPSMVEKRPSRFSSGRSLSDPASRFSFLVSRLSFLFVVSFIFLWLHILDDAIITNEPAWYGITIPEFLLYCAFVYAIVPPLGVWLARRGSVWGLLIVLVYAFQAVYGAGLNHIKHLFGDFSGSRLLPTLLGLFGVHITDIRGHGFWTVIMGMAGLGVTPPHQHILVSTIVAFTNVALNLALIVMSALALYTWWQMRSMQRESLIVTHPTQ
jgi:hypothetical protein